MSQKVSKNKYSAFFKKGTHTNSTSYHFFKWESKHLISIRGGPTQTRQFHFIAFDQGTFKY
ncbi:uncharacterized protein METZ01_LOCUS334236 [marine metagenome]|uniref:Uncharacterized protein n=1 Tax=marine metagenome TaxID=408172 RepID=A0A382QA21_9ZZZZ